MPGKPRLRVSGLQHAPEDAVTCPKSLIWPSSVSSPGTETRSLARKDCAIWGKENSEPWGKRRWESKHRKAKRSSGQGQQQEGGRLGPWSRPSAGTFPRHSGCPCLWHRTGWLCPGRQPLDVSRRIKREESGDLGQKLSWSGGPAAQPHRCSVRSGCHRCLSPALGHHPPHQPRGTQFPQRGFEKDLERIRKATQRGKAPAVKVAW